jgi:hypothetical protein
VPGFAAVLAHQGGWDEALMVALPIGLFALLLRVATVRADRQAPQDHPPRGGRGAGDGG